MTRLLDLANEVFCQILDDIKPHDIESFSLSYKTIYCLAAKRLQQHKLLKKRFMRVESIRDPWQGSVCVLAELLHQVLLEPSKGDYVQQISVDIYHMHECYCPPHSYPAFKTEAFQKAVRNTQLIPLDEKNRWIRQINAGNEHPVLALLLPQLHYLTRIKISMAYLVDDFLFPTLRHIIKDPHSASFSRLREVEVIHARVNCQRPLCLLTVFAALSSVTSLKGGGLAEESLSPVYDELGFSLIKGSSNIQELDLEGCNAPCSALTDLIKSTKSLRSFKYSLLGSLDNFSRAYHIRYSTPSTIDKVRAVLLQHASSSLEELTLRRARDGSDEPEERSFKSFQRLRVLNIDFALLTGNQTRTTQKIVTLLPKLLEILSLFDCDILDFAWLEEVVKWVIKGKERAIRCLKELHFLGVLNLDRCRPGDLKELCTAATEAGFELKVVPKRRW